jgi:glycerophosphoryl diester phosphodiesterase
MTWEIRRDRVLNIAHRGARSLAPENTLAAARKALETGADMWELDVAMTRDGELIVLHDATLDRTSNAKDILPRRRPWRVREFTLEEVRSLDFGTWFVEQDPFGQIGSGAVSHEEVQSYAGEPAPLLREALAFTREYDWAVNVEIKDLGGAPGDAHIVERVVALVEEMGMLNHVHVSSFNMDYLRRVKSWNPDVSVGVLRSRKHGNPGILLTKLGARLYHPRIGIVGIHDIQRFRDEGIDVLVWVVNDEETMRELIAARVSGIFTDFPQTLARVLS